MLFIQLSSIFNLCEYKKWNLSVQEVLIWCENYYVTFETYEGHGNALAIVSQPVDHRGRQSMRFDKRQWEQWGAQNQQNR